MNPSPGNVSRPVTGQGVAGGTVGDTAGMAPSPMSVIGKIGNSGLSEALHRERDDEAAF
jgi:hypothetical protein